MLLILTPFLAETVASSNTPALLFPVLLPVYLVVYGVPALLVRELWVRRRVGWPGMLVLGVAYAALNEGVVSAVWFKLQPGTGRVLAFTAGQAGHAMGVNWVLVVGLVVFHTAFSLVLPLALAECWAVARSSPHALRPWLRAPGLLIGTGLIILLVAGSLTPASMTRVCAGPAAATCAPGRAGAAVLIPFLVLVAILLPRRRIQSVGRRPAPRARTLTLLGCGWATAFLGTFFALPLSGHPWLSIAGSIALLLVAVVAVTRWVNAPDWLPWSTTCLAFGALLPGMLLSLARLPVLQPVAAVLALLLFRFLRSRLRPPPAPLVVGTGLISPPQSARDRFR